MKIFMLITALLLTACAASGVHVSEDQVSQFQNGETTYQDVVDKLGPPSQKSVDSSGNIEVSYIYSEYKTRPETFIPYAGAFVGGADSRSNTTVLEFNSKGVLQDYSFSETALGTTTNLSAGVPNDRVHTKTRNK